MRSMNRNQQEVIELLSDEDSPSSTAAGFPVRARRYLKKTNQEEVISILSDEESPSNTVAGSPLRGQQHPTNHNQNMSQEDNPSSAAAGSPSQAREEPTTPQRRTTIRNPYSPRTRRPGAPSVDTDESERGGGIRCSLFRSNDPRRGELPADRVTSPATRNSATPASVSQETQSPDMRQESATSTVGGGASTSSETEEKRRIQLLSPQDKLFAALLLNSPEDLVSAAGEGDNATLAADRLLGVMCVLLDLPKPTMPLRAKCDTVREHMQSRAGLVLEEARHVLSDSFVDLRKPQSKPAFEMEMMIVRDEKDTFSWGVKKAYPHKRSFQRTERIEGQKGWFDTKTIETISMGLVVECSRNDVGVPNVLLGCVVTSNKAVMASTGLVDIVFYHKAPEVPEDSCWTIRPLGTTLIHTVRKFSAVMDYQKVPPFFDVVRGIQVPTHTVNTPGAATPSIGPSDNGFARNGSSSINLTELCASPEQLRLPSLNDSQQKATSVFLDAPDGSVTVVQGPPGTGKTTFCVSVICQYLLRPLPAGRKHRMLICAPTNKAISHVACRFLSKIRSKDVPNLKILLIGDVDKLGVNLKPDDVDSDFPASPRSVYLYTWLESTLDQYRYLLTVEPNGDSLSRMELDEMRNLADSLRKRMRSSLGKLPPAVETGIDTVYQMLDSKINGEAIEVEEFRRKVESLIVQIKLLTPFTVRAQLMNSANVIFSTLSATRSAAALATGQVDCLIVDEAAAATEPDLYIPFHLQPSKMLVVGDPLQLPAIVQSKRAKRFGLDESFHERLMNRLGCREILLLDTQYRMKPPISFFPAKRFYSGMLKNGGNVVSPHYGAATTTLCDNRAYVFMPVEGAVESDKSSLNRKEALVVLDLLKEMRTNAEGRPWTSDDSLRVISFYQAQVTLIRSLLKANGFANVSVGTVDSSQGCESDIVIVSFVRGLGTAGFLTDDRRINVAITRARHQLICIGNVEAMVRLPGYHTETLRQLSSDASTRGAIM